MAKDMEDAKIAARKRWQVKLMQEEDIEKKIKLTSTLSVSSLLTAGRMVPTRAVHTSARSMVVMIGTELPGRHVPISAVIALFAALRLETVCHGPASKTWDAQYHQLIEWAHEVTASGTISCTSPCRQARQTSSIGAFRARIPFAFAMSRAQSPPYDGYGPVGATGNRGCSSQPASFFQPVL